MRPALIVVRAGDRSLHTRWDDGGPREYDVLVSYYGRERGRYRATADHYHEMEGLCWSGNADVCTSMKGTVEAYEHVAFCDDDVMATSRTWNRLFEVCRERGLDLASPAFSGYAERSLSPARGATLRHTNLIELICPVFSRRALAHIGWTFSESWSGWGLSTLWAHLCPREEWPTAIVDAAVVEHTRPFGGGDIYDEMGRRGLTSAGELQRILLKHGLKRATRVFFGTE